MLDDKLRLEKQTPQESFDDFTAIGIAEGFIEVDSETKKVAAWQHLLDTGLCWRLQGWFGRQATEMIQEGIIKPKTKE
jgi:hypothetical protein